MEVVNQKHMHWDSLNAKSETKVSLHAPCCVHMSSISNNIDSLCYPMVQTIDRIEVKEKSKLYYW